MEKRDYGLQEIQHLEVFSSLARDLFYGREWELPFELKHPPMRSLPHSFNIFKRRKAIRSRLAEGKSFVEEVDRHKKSIARRGRFHYVPRVPWVEALPAAPEECAVAWLIDRIIERERQMSTDEALLVAIREHNRVGAIYGIINSVEFKRRLEKNTDFTLLLERNLVRACFLECLRDETPPVWGEAEIDPFHRMRLEMILADERDTDQLSAANMSDDLDALFDQYSESARCALAMQGLVEVNPLGR